MLGPGRKRGKYEVKAVRELTREEVRSMRPAKAAANPVKRFRDSHHHMARLFAAGLTVSEVAELTGYSVSRVSVFHCSPAFQGLIAEKRGIEDQIARDKIEAYNDFILSNGIKAERKLADKLDDDDESEMMSVRELLAISRDAADRVGLSKRSLQTNVNIDWAAALDRAIARSAELPRSADLKVISPPTATAAGLGSFKRRI